MAKVYLTGSKKFLGTSTPQNSLGGYLSSSELEDGSINNLFPGISSFSIWNTNDKQYRCICILNDEEEIMEGVRVWLEPLLSDDSDIVDITIADIQVSATSVISDSCGDLKTRHIAPSQTGKPQGLTFVTANDYATGLYLGSIEPGDYAAFFICRTLNANAKAPIADDTLCAISSNTVTLASFEDYQLVIDWEDPSEDSDSI